MSNTVDKLCSIEARANQVIKWRKKTKRQRQDWIEFSINPIFPLIGLKRRSVQSWASITAWQTFIVW
jgi:hypothetical protein